jgi:hypothetical protein
MNLVYGALAVVGICIVGLGLASVFEEQQLNSSAGVGLGLSSHDPPEGAKTKDASFHREETPFEATFSKQKRLHDDQPGMYY